MIKDLSAATLANRLLTLLGQQWKVKNELLRRPTLWKPHWRQEEWKADRGRLCSYPLVCPGALDFRYSHVAAGIGVCQSTDGAVALQGRHLVWTQESLPQNPLQNLSHELKKTQWAWSGQREQQQWPFPGHWPLLSGKECNARQLRPVFGRPVYYSNENGLRLTWRETLSLYCRYNRSGLKPRNELSFAIISEELPSYWKSIVLSPLHNLAAEAQRTQQEMGFNLQNRNIPTLWLCRSKGALPILNLLFKSCFSSLSLSYAENFSVIMASPTGYSLELAGSLQPNWKRCYWQPWVLMEGKALGRGGRKNSIQFCNSLANPWKAVPRDKPLICNFKENPWWIHFKKIGI